MWRLKFALFLLIATPAFAAFNADQFKGMQWREIGPFRGGRADAVEGIVAQPNTYYFGSCGGGVFKKIFGGGGAALSLKFSGQASAATEAAHRGLKLDKLKPGMYVLELQVTDQSGRRDQRLQPFQVVEE